MPVAQSFYEPSAPARHVRGVDASEYTRFVRMAATVAPYINPQTTFNRPFARLGQSQEANLDARFVSTIFSGLRPFVANK
uniref:Uncharacterized protein n=1 Tax=viral metagenome TaxID=1070528 RepID=A0A6C0AK77_9ZZZZ